MYTGDTIKKHYVLKFKGYINHTFEFTINETFDPFIGDIDSNWTDHCTVKDDGWLYIDGWRITNNDKSIETILHNLKTGNIEHDTGEAYVDASFAIDSSGYVVNTGNSHSSNKVDRFFCKLFG